MLHGSHGADILDDVARIDLIVGNGSIYQVTMNINKCCCQRCNKNLD